MLPTRRVNAHKIKSLLLSDYFILFLIAAIYVVVVSFLAVSRHNLFQTNAWDLGIYSQSLYSTLNHGNVLYYTAELAGNPQGSLFGIHFTPFLLLLLPVYAVFPNPITLLILRPIAITVGLIPLYWIIRDQQLNNRLVTFFLAIIYLVYPPITTPLSNFDITVFLPALFLFALYYMKKGKLYHSLVFVALALMVNEFVPLIVAMLAVYVVILNRKEIFDGLLSKKLTKHAKFAIALLLAAFVVFNVGSAVITSFNPNALTTKWEWGELGSNPQEIVGNVLTNPLQAIKVLLNDGQNKFLYVTALFAPLAFFSFLDPLMLLMTVPWLGASLLSINPLYYAVGTHYPAFVSPFLFVAAVTGIKKLANSNSKAILNKLAFLMFVTLVLSLFLLPTGDYFSVTKTNESTNLALTQIPSDASVSAMPEIFPHLCNRLNAYPYFKDGVDYVLVNIYSWWYTVTLPRPAHLTPTWSKTEIGTNYGLVVNANGVLLYKKGYTGDIQYFDGVDFTYKCGDVDIATGTIVQDTIPVGDTFTQTDVLFHAATNAAPLFFEVPEKVLPPGNYKVSVMLKTASTTPTEVIKITAYTEPEASVIATRTLNGQAFIKPGTWHVFTVDFSLEQPTFVDFAAYVTNSTAVSFYSFNVSQVSGGV
ncbi:MAG: DUF2079 domain-containing protein [Candidatus Bathyarchaeia archaeon]